MGLDMYLTKKHYVQRWDHTPAEKQFEVTVKQGGEEYTHINANKVKYIEEEAGYWRKANHIHRWFVENVQEGEDNCEEFWVSPRKIEELYMACKEVLNEKEKAKEFLPTQSGFFFGGTEYDEYYFRDIENTAEMIKPILEDMDQGGNLPYDLYYQSSW
jgi:hypothetical protein